MSATIRLCMLMLLVGAAVPLAISIDLGGRPVGPDSRLKLWLLALAFINAALQLLENAQWLNLMSLSQAATAHPGGTAAMPSELVGAVRASWRWTHYTHIAVVVGWLWVLFIALLRMRAVPQVLALTGALAAPLHLVGIVLPVFAGYRMILPDAFGVPLALAIVASALWLIFHDVDATDRTAGSQLAAGRR